MPDASGRFAVHRSLAVAAGAFKGLDEVLAALLSLDVYRDHFQGPIGQDSGGDADSVHGPYRLDALQPASFPHIDAARANSLLDEWLAQEGSCQWEGPGAERLNEQFRSGQPAVQAWFTQARRVFDWGDIAFLPEAPEASQHEAGWTLWEFREWVVFDSERSRVEVLTLGLD